MTENDCKNCKVSCDNPKGDLEPKLTSGRGLGMGFRTPGRVLEVKLDAPLLFCLKAPN